MEPQIKKLLPKKLIGKHMNMSLTTNKTGELWKSFMQQRREIENPNGSDLYSMQLYDSHYFQQFSPANAFVKWAAIEVADFSNVPDGMETFTLPGGLYAVFHYKGPASGGAKIFQYIFQTWLPNSDYTLDDRPHFELLGEKYINEHPDSEEEIWIPIKPKSDY